MIRIRRRAFGLLGGAALLFLAATNIQSGWLFVLSALLLGAVAGGVVIPVSMVRGLAVHRRAPPEAFVGEDVQVDLVVENRAGGIRASVLVHDQQIAPTSVFVGAIPPGGQVTARTRRLAARRGVVDGAPVVVSSSAPFGVAEARRRVPSSGRTVIFPRIVPLAPLGFLGGPAPRQAAFGRPSRPGRGLEFLGVRDYRHGDSLRDVHWPSTARRGALVVREMEREDPASLVVLVDTWGDEEEGETALDLCCTVAASAAVLALRAGHDVLLGGAQLGEAGPPAAMGRREALTWLAGLAAPGGLPLSVVIDRATAAARGGAALIVLPTWEVNTGAALRRPVAALATAALSVVVAVVDASGYPGSPESSRALDPAGVRDLLGALASAGAEVRVVGSVDDLGPGLGRPAGPAWGRAS